MPKVTLRKEISSQKIAGALKRGNGCLKEFARKTGYTPYFIDEDDSILCPSCAQKALLDLCSGAEPVNMDFVKDEEVYCAFCGCKVEDEAIAKV